MRRESVEALAPEPLANRDVEAALAPPEVLGGEPPLGPALEEQLALAPAHLQLVGQPQAELDHAMVEERHAPLEAEGHQDAVRLHEQVVGQPGAEVGVL